MSSARQCRGRGWLQGFPTANLDPEDCRTRVKAHCFDLEGGPGRVSGNPDASTAMPKGVYFG